LLKQGRSIQREIKNNEKHVRSVSITILRLIYVGRKGQGEPHMKYIGRTLVLLLSLSVAVYGTGNSFDKIRYNGGTIETKVNPKDWDNNLSVTSEVIRLQLKDGQILSIDPSRVTGLSYGQEAHRRVGTMIALGILVAPLALFGLFHKTRLHFVGIEYTTSDGKKAGILLQAHKENYRAVLMALRGATGAPVAVGEEDRKYVPTGIEALAAPSSKEVPRESSESDIREHETIDESDQQPTEAVKVQAQDSAKITPKSEQVEIGMTQDQVQSVMGRPTQSSKWLDSDGTTVIGQLMYVTANEKIYVKLRNGKVQSIQQN
jgi:hypothetical protein